MHLRHVTGEVLFRGNDDTQNNAQGIRREESQRSIIASVSNFEGNEDCCAGGEAITIETILSEISEKFRHQ